MLVCLASTADLSGSLESDYGESDVCVVSYMGVIARIWLLSPPVLQQACIRLTANGI
jgi:hypothetical protein